MRMGNEHLLTEWGTHQILIGAFIRGEKWIGPLLERKMGMYHC